MLSLALLPFMGILANLASAYEPTYENFEDLEDREEVLREAFDDVLQMCNYLTEYDVPSFLEEYFYKEDQDDIYDVFKTILGDNSGGEILESITIDGTDFNDGCNKIEELAYSVPVGMSLRVHFCDSMWNNGWRPKNEMELDDLDDTVSWKMDHIGRLYIHEIMHHPGVASAKDIAYGPYDVRRLTGEDPVSNADTWAWFATQQLWTILATIDFDEPAKGDDLDPRCDDRVCKVM